MTTFSIDSAGRINYETEIGSSKFLAKYQPFPADLGIKLREKLKLSEKGRITLSIVDTILFLQTLESILEPEVLKTCKDFVLDTVEFYKDGTKIDNQEVKSGHYEYQVALGGLYVNFFIFAYGVERIQLLNSLQQEQS